MKARYGQSLSPWKFDRKLKHKAVHYNDNDNSSPEMYDWKRVIIVILASFKADDDGMVMVQMQNHLLVYNFYVITMIIL